MYKRNVVNGSLIVNLTSRRVMYDVVIDEFPAFEMYVAVNGSAGQLLLTANPLPRKTV